ncbi:MAG: exodeoxyribonuclease V subunit beta [Desulfobacterota bacterium]|nr:exodeoxyribonuclease V subunit beta [Thermodesulfobacteriota bacterium]
MRPLDLPTIPLDGTNLIEASAGTGKTYTLAHLYLRLLLERACTPASILVVTFTEAATKELRDRIRKNLVTALNVVQERDPPADPLLQAILDRQRGEKREQAACLKRALINFDEAAIFTIHGFCKRMLSQNCFESGVPFTAELITDQQTVVQEILDDFWLRTISGAAPLIGAVAEAGGFTMQKCRELATTVIQKPFVKVVPPPTPDWEMRLCGLFGRLREVWHRDRATLTAILSHDKGLKRSEDTYRHDKLTEYEELLDAAFTDTPSQGALKVLQLFSTSAITKNTKARHEPPQHEFFDLCEAFCNEQRNAIVALSWSVIEQVRTELPRRKRSRMLQSFDDLLNNMLTALRSPSGNLLAASIRRTFSAALIDEFQDTDPVQYEIFYRLFHGVADHSLFLIGDPKQSIYGFRGADIFSYLAAAKRTPHDHRYTLTTNWRSETACVEAVNRLFAGVRNPFVLGEGIMFHPGSAAPNSKGNSEPLRVDGEVGSGMRLWFLQQGEGGFSNKEDALEVVADAVVREIARLLTLASEGKARLGSRTLQPSDFAILVLRNQDAQLFVEPLRALNIPAVLAQAENIFLTDDARELVCLLRAIASPRRIDLVHAALATQLLGYDAATLRCLAEEERMGQTGEEHAERFIQYANLWATKGFMSMFRTLLEQYRVRENLLELPDGERRLTNVLHLAEVLHEASRNQRLGPSGLLSFLSRHVSAPLAQEEHELRLERDEEAVQILTVYKSKGLQYPIVFCPFLWQKGAKEKNAKALYHEQDAVVLDLGSPDKDRAEAQAAEERLAELVRVLYVAITRAQNRCYLACGKIGKPAATALDYIFSGGAERDAVNATLASPRIASSESLRHTLQEQSPGADTSIVLEAPCSQEPKPYCGASQQDTLKGAPRSFPEHGICRDRGIASYSLLVAGEHTGGEETIVKRDELLADAQPLEAAAESFFAFPRGTLAGSCIHALFEQLDFTCFGDVDPLIERCLQRYGLDGAFRSSVRDMIGRVLTTPLVPLTDLVLSSIPRSRRLSELSFFYPIRTIVPQQLAELFATHWPQAASDGTAERMGRLVFKPIHGFMHGFIDMVFLHEGKYYLCDWKTNHLGNAYTDYAPDRLKKAVQESYYTLQYALYTVALHNYLRQCVSGYSYERYFGGVLYLFVRGITPEHPGCGIFYDCPPPSFVEACASLTKA